MAKRPQEYVTPEGRVTTNSIEGFLGLALKYRGKRIDLHHTHYTCKTNMAIYHKVRTTGYVYYCDVNTNSEPWPTVEGCLFMEHGCRCPSICCNSCFEREATYF